MADVIMKEKWAERIKDWPTEEKIKLLGALVWHGYSGENCEKYLDDNVYMKGMYRELSVQETNIQKAVNYGGAHGRKPAFNDEENEKICKLAREGKSAKEIAESMGIVDNKKIKDIYNSKGWKLGKS